MSKLIDFRCQKTSNWCLKKGWLNDLRNLIDQVNESKIIPSKQFWKQVMKRISIVLNDDQIDQNIIKKFSDKWNLIANSQSGFKIPKIRSTVNPRKLSILSGPISFFFYHDFQGRRVLLLGDRHDAEHLCNVNVCNINQKPLDCHVYEVHDWLMDLAKSSPECLDFFCEFSYITTEN